MHIANSDKPVKIYSLDIILAVGYRTNSSRAIKFRQWATKELEGEVASLRTKVDLLVDQNITPSQGIFYDGQIYDAYAFVNDLYSKAPSRMSLS